MLAVSGPFEPSLLPGFDVVFAHQSCGPSPADREALVLHLSDKENSPLFRGKSTLACAIEMVSPPTSKPTRSKFTVTINHTAPALTRRAFRLMV
ncbi:hypothetical protein [Sphingosinicella soli]|uniref:Uncharacterized protein n=1 Tax=Sphingosinicella soli TaxID=333708 RepID=A0A7W7AZP4_9SPHN|nr:hypothetical protein [Sphingosinicella soli]MBB4631336.1 hypothetical protein [Sphingosinicella soli]